MLCFTDRNAWNVITHLYAAGTETTSTALLWAFLFMCLHPDVQEKVHVEIDEHLGKVY